MNFICKKCGKCCGFFSNQIRYYIDPAEENWLDLPKKYKNLINFFNKDSKFYTLRLEINKKTLKKNKKPYFIPTKRELLESNYDFPEELRKNYVNCISMDECIFLHHVENDYLCSIHEIHPFMCTAYPKNKGFVCISQKDRYFSKTYLEHKKTKFKDIIITLNKIFPYFQNHDLQFSWDIFLFLIDFGTFDYNELEDFFISKMDWTNLQFKYAIKDLQKFGLIFGYFDQENKNYVIESISSTSIKSKIEEYLTKTNS